MAYGRALRIRCEVGQRTWFLPVVDEVAADAGRLGFMPQLLRVGSRVMREQGGCVPQAKSLLTPDIMSPATSTLPLFYASRAMPVTDKKAVRYDFANR